MKCLIIDGWHSGHLIEMPEPPPELRLLRPSVNTTCSCNHEDEHITHSEPKEESYRAAFKSLDGKVVLYTPSGDSENILESRDWIVRRPYSKGRAVEVECHDPRAFP